MTAEWGYRASVLVRRAPSLPAHMVTGLAPRTLRELESFVITLLFREGLHRTRELVESQGEILDGLIGVGHALSFPFRFSVPLTLSALGGGRSGRRAVATGELAD